ncbi:MAG: 16S rRNA (guanine(527)-N(7))-methyltransferase RsmG [Treponematales bacterium]
MNDTALEEGVDVLIRSSAETAGALAPRLGVILAQLARYIEEIERFNPVYGLVKVKDRRELVVRHILDSLAPLGVLLPLLKPPCALADAGSGAGLPGIPLAVCLPQVKVTLIERMARRAGFLRNAAAVLGLSNVSVEEAEMENAAPARFRAVAFRAFRPLDKPVLKGLLRLLTPERAAFLAAWKGRRAAVEAEMAALALPPGLCWKAVPVKTPFLDEERRLVLLRKAEPAGWPAA